MDKIQKFLQSDVSLLVNKLTKGCEKLADTETIGVREKGIISGKKVIDGICNVNQGIVTGKDRYLDKKKNINKGIFIIDKEELIELDLAREEKSYVKSFFKNSDIKKYYTEKKPHYFLLYVNDIEK